MVAKFWKFFDNRD